MENESNALYTCSECPNEKRKTFKSEKGLIRHKSSMHNDKLYKYKKYRCYLCNLSFKDKTNYVLHTEVYHEGRNQELAVCNDCGKQFKDKTQLSVHLQSKCGTVRRYKCDECDKLLMTQGSLYTHKLRHANKRRYMCRYCAKTFYTDGQCQVHERKHTKEKAFVCEVCNKGFSHRQSLITHTTIHTGVKPYACEACHSEFSCIGNLLKHRRTHANTCGKLPLTTHRVDNTDTKLKLQLNTPSNTRLKETKKKKILLSLLNDNKMINDNDLALNLDKLKLNKTIENDNDTSIRKTNEVHNVINQINDKSLIVKSEINDNAIPEILSNDNIIQLDKVKSESDNEKYFDDVKSEIDNDNIYNDDNDIDNIWIKEENMKDDDNDNDNVMVIKFESDMKLNCNEQNDNELFNDNVQNDDIYSESDTEYSLDLQTRLQKLRKTKNSIKNISHSESIKCKYCDRIFKNDSYWFKRHLEKHEHEQQQSNQRQFKCSCCKEVFVNKIERNEHQQKEHLDILHCSTCDKTFNHIRSIESHKKYSHKGEKRKTYTYICEKCGRSDFKSKTFLQQHNYLNECNDLIKQFKCNVCMKYFANKYTLNTHQTKLHRNYNNNNNNNTTTEVITFKCNYCFKSFNWKGQLKIHERSHTGEKPFKCQFCPKSFAYRESLITHNSLHTGIKPHLCLSCGARFSCIGNLLKHKRTHAATCGADTIDKQTDDNNKMKINIEKIRSDTNRLNMIGVHLKKIEHKTQL